MKVTGFAAAVVAGGMIAFAGSAEAKVPFFNAKCGDKVEVHADEGGPVYINGKEAQLTTINDKAYEAHKAKVTISITINPDGSVAASATWKDGSNGICTVAGDAMDDGEGAAAGSGECPVDVSEADRAKYPACN